MQGYVRMTLKTLLTMGTLKMQSITGTLLWSHKCIIKIYFTLFYTISHTDYMNLPSQHKHMTVCSQF